MTIKAPASAAGGNWDCLITYMGVDSHNTKTYAPKTFNGVPTGLSYDHAAITGARMGALLVDSDAAGVQLGFARTTGDKSVLHSDEQARGRTIGVAFEVTNTTAEVYKQGSVTVSALPEVLCDGSCIVVSDTNATPWEDAQFQLDWGPTYAATVSQLQAIPSSATWAASEGVYAIPRLTMDPLTTHPSVCSRALAWGQNGVMYAQSPTGVQVINGKSFPEMFSLQPNGFSPMQAFFSGLSNESSLTLTFRVIKEYFPGVGATLLPIASPSPAYDPYVLAMYSEMVKTLPCAVPVTMNPAGEYFRKVLRAAAQAAQIMAPVFGSYAPVVQLGAAAALAALPKKKVVNKAAIKVDRKGAGARAMVTRR